MRQRRPVARPRPEADPPGTAARRAALRLLMAVLDRGVPLEAGLDNALNDVRMTNDRALARLLASTVLRWLPDLDALIDSATERPLPDDARARHVLRIALASRLRLDTPPHAVVATALPLVDKGPRRLVHGVLARLLREVAGLPESPSLPAPFAERWRRDWGEAAAVAAARSLADEPPTDLSLRAMAETAEWASALGGISLAPGHVRVARHGALADWPGFAEGAWWVQDLAASLPARLVQAQPGERVLDLCAAPGGKTLQLAATGARVTALDVSEQRLERLADNLQRTGLSADVVCADALQWEPQGPFDRILLDAPCSATGIFRRHPDVLHLKGSRDISPLVALQSALIDRAVGWLRPGGTLAYATCSLDPAEGERQLAALLERHPHMRLDPVAASELPAGVPVGRDGHVRTLPGQLAASGGLDGFFIARLRKA